VVLVVLVVLLARALVTVWLVARACLLVVRVVLVVRLLLVHRVQVALVLEGK
jgi:hypothetical protein